MAAFNAGITRMKSYFIKGVLIIYIIAFTSLYLQAQSLFGDNGIVPLRDFFSKSKVPVNLHSIIAPKLGLTHGGYIELLCLLCIVVAMAGLLVRRLANALTFGFLWFIYYSICTVGQGFMSFHSDLLLLEVGFITILLAPLLPSSKISQSDHDHLTFFLIRWLTFRYFVTNVLNVYLDNDDAWYKMTAIPIVAQGVQFPSLFSWHIFNLPTEVLKVYQAYEHSVKICAPFLMLFDLKYSRLLGFYTLIFVAFPSALFFNFGWTDLLICVCLITYLKDAYFYDDKRAKQSGMRTFVDIVMVFSYISVVVALLVAVYDVKYYNNVLQSNVKFTPTQFKAFAQHFVPACLMFGVLGLVSSLRTTYRGPSKKTSVVKTLIYTLIIVPLFLSTFPTLMKFAPGLESKVKPLSFTKDLSRLSAPYMLSNNYILMSKVSQHYADGRPELQIQGKSDGQSDWHQFDLRYKPGIPSREPPRVIPHLPRIDLKLWYAARSSLQSNQWLQTFAYRIATKERDVIGVLAQDMPVPQVSMMRVATIVYKYSSKGRHPFAGYWSQSKYKADYMPETSVDSLRSFVKASGISMVPSTKTTHDPKSNSLDKLFRVYLEIASDYLRSLNHTAVIWSLGAIVATVSIFR